MELDWFKFCLVRMGDMGKSKISVVFVCIWDSVTLLWKYWNVLVGSVAMS